MSADPLKLRLHVETEFVRQISRALDRRFGGSFAVAHSAADSAAADAVAGIQQANHADYARAYHWCARCRRRIPVQQFTATRQRYGRGYCRHCADEIGLENQNFESTVEGAKRLRSTGGTAVQSRGEQRIAEFLEREHIAYEYDERYRVAADLMIRPDFYLPEFDLYIEYWGMDTQEYRERKLRKRILYQRERKQLIEIVSGDLDRLDEVLREKLGRYIRI